MFIQIRYIILFGVLVIVQFGYSQTVKLGVTINNLKEATGAIVVSIFNQENDFPVDGKEFRKMSFAVKALSVTCTINDLKRGDYAIAIFHDQNNDGICNLGFLGIPKEGFGFSKNFVPRLKAPAFDDCKIELFEDRAITIDLIFR